MASSSRGALVAVVTFFGAFLAIIAVGLRLWSRRLQRLSLAFNDYMAILALVVTIADCSTTLAIVFIGALGAHSAKLQAENPEALRLYARFSFAGHFLWVSANTTVKVCILSLYTVLFPSKRFCRLCYAMIAVSIVFFLGVVTEPIFSCQPVQYNWDKTIPHGRCHGQILAYITNGVLNLVIDALILVLPMRTLYRLRMSGTKRIAIGAMFGLGALVCLISLLRVLSIMRLRESDRTYTGISFSIYSVLEPTLGVVNACLPTTRPALNRLLKNRLFGRIQEDGSGFSSSNTAVGGNSLNRRSLFSHHSECVEDGIPLTKINAATPRRGSAVDEGDTQSLSVDGRIISRTTT
ncbi:hypothetical protein F4777DRAFT_576032 [Nemania sp. FL0916]|nr:hypothetical protein F4777DRAFT_576032 [Nemania sp. FL0916]